MKIEAGRSYRTRDGQKAEITGIDPRQACFPVIGRVGSTSDAWCEHGRYSITGPDRWGTVAEWVDDDRVPDLILKGSVIPRPPGLSLLEAMQSGKEFKEIGGSSWFHVASDGHTCFRDDKVAILSLDKLTARYELKPDAPKSVQVTAGDIYSSYSKWRKESRNISVGPSDLIAALINDLGLGDDK